MTLFVGQAGTPKRKHASRVAGFAAAAIAAAALIGEWAGLPLLSNWGSGPAAVKPMTALSLTALGLTIVCPGKTSRFALAVGLAVAAIAALDLFGVDFGVNRGLAPRAALHGPDAASFEMINGMPVAIALAGGSLALSRFEGHHFTATALGGLAGVMAAFSVLTHLTGIHALYSSVAPPALPIAVGLLCIAGAMVLRVGTMPALRKARPLWQLQVMLGCAIIAPLLLFGVYTTARIAVVQLHLVQNDLMSQARILSAGVDRQMIGEIERLQALAASPSLRRGDLAEFQRQAEASLALLQRGNIVLIDRNMQQLVNTFVPFGKPLPKAVASTPVERTFATGKPQVTSLFMAPVVNEFMFGITVPVEIGGEVRYVLGRSQDQHALARLVAANGLPPGWLAALADRAHRIIARSDQEDAFIGSELPPAQWHRAGPGGVFGFTDPEGQPSLEASALSELTGWETAVWAPKGLLEAPARALWWTIVLTALMALMLVVALASWLGRIIARSVGHAARAAIALGEGSPLPTRGTPVAEVNTLMTELQQTTDLLRDSKDRLQLALNAAQLGWWQYDPRHGVISWDTRSKEILHITEDWTALEDVIKLVYAGDAERVWTAFQAARNPSHRKPYAIEFQVQSGEGEVRWVEVHWLAYFKETQPERTGAGVVGTIADITERKEREEQVQLLMREVNHRAKNMLSVVDAIAHQTATKNSEDFIERFSERIQALSANQDLLVRSDWGGVNIEDLTRAQLSHFADLIGSRIVLDGPRLRLNPASAQAIGLALHELATNAGKYGALSTDRGRVDVCWETHGDTFTINWAERDGPSVCAPKRRGFGTIVMETMAERSVDGTVDLDYAPSGVIWRLTCPAANVREPSEREQNSSESRTEGTGKLKAPLTF